MDNSIHEQELGTQDQESFLGDRMILSSIINWLTHLIRLTEEEQQDAGIYPGRLGDE